MNYHTVMTVSNAEVRLYDDVLDKILRKHGELKGMEALIIDTVASPDLVLLGHDRELLAVKTLSYDAIGIKRFGGRLP
ncbi:MAG: hypothetical protein ABSF63_12090 [Candidatus Bathyarchaeia archaeon]